MTKNRRNRKISKSVREEWEQILSLTYDSLLEVLKEQREKTKKK
jgi:hypothetical protein